MKIGNLIIVILVLVVVVLSAALWLSLDAKTPPLPTASSAQPTKTVAPASEPLALRPASLPATSAPVAQLSERDKKYLRHGIDPSVGGHKINVNVVK